MRRRTHWIAAVAFTLVIAACGRGGRSAGPQPRNPGIARPLEVYHDLGMLAGPFDFPAVASFSTFDGPADKEMPNDFGA